MANAIGYVPGLSVSPANSPSEMASQNINSSLNLMSSSRDMRKRRADYKLAKEHPFMSMLFSKNSSNRQRILEEGPPAEARAPKEAGTYKRGQMQGARIRARMRSLAKKRAARDKKKIVNVGSSKPQKTPLSKRGLG